MESYVDMTERVYNGDLALNRKLLNCIKILCRPAIILGMR